MDFLSFLRREFLDIRPSIEGTLDGVWRLEESRMIRPGGDELLFADEPFYEEVFYLEFRDGHMAHFLHTCYDENSGESADPAAAPARCTRTPYGFNPADGVLFCETYYARVQSLDDARMILLDAESLGAGAISRGTYRRVAR